MSLVNPLTHEISAKIVYYGPGLSGKTTSLKRIYTGVRPDRRGELISLATEGDRTIFFDFLPLQVERVRDMGVRLQLYTVPGQVFYAATRKLVLNGADGVVFVADSHPSARQANLESFESMRNILAELGIDLELFPFVLQYNKRDLESVMSVEQMNTDLNWLGAPAFETAATEGRGVLTALKEIIRQVVRSLWVQQPERPPSRSGKPEPAATREPSVGLVASLRQAVDAASARTESEQAAPRSVRPEARGISFASLFAERGHEAVVNVEHAIARGEYADAVRLASAAVAAVLGALPGVTSEPSASRAALLGVDGREYLKLQRLAAQPESALRAEDALFALHVVIAVQLKAAAA